MRFLPYPFVRITLLFIAGILLGIYQPQFLPGTTLQFSLLLIVLFYFLGQYFLRRSYYLKYFAGALGMAFIFIAGVLVVTLRTETRSAEHLIHIKEKVDAFQVRLISNLEPTQNGYRALGEVLTTHANDQWQKANGQVTLYWKTADSTYHLGYGVTLIVNASPRPIDPPWNPDEFDFKKYLGYKNIYHQCFVKQGSWEILESNREQNLIAWALRARQWSLQTIHHWIVSPREQAIVSALVLGVTDGIDPDLLQAYAANGAMHVLAVSGLHVAIIYGLLLFLMKPLNKSTSGKWLIAVISLLVLWGYAFLTGLSPSVLRAVVMFSFVVLAQPLKKRTNIYNTLAASAFFLLLYDPFMIMSVGFQLSYIAVWGIVALQRPIYLWLVPSNTVYDWLWKMTSVSIAAQISTFALSLFYFHQFPTYFLISNLFVIPGSFVILLGGILLLIISPWNFGASLCATILQWLVWLMNEGLFLIEDFPLSLISPISITVVQCWLLYTLIMVSMLLLFQKTFSWLWVIHSLVVVFAVDGWRTDRQQAIPEWTVYRIPGQQAISWIANDRIDLRLDSMLSPDSRAFKFHVKPHLDKFKQGFQPFLMTEKHNNLQLICWKGKTFLWIHDRMKVVPESITVDFLIISHEAVNNLGIVANHVNFDQLILDSSNSYKYSQRMKKAAEGLGKASHSVIIKGAYTLKLPYGTG